MEYYTAMKKNEIRLFIVTWIYLKIIILSEVCQMDKYHMLFFYKKPKKKKKIQMNLFTKQKYTHRHRKQI